MSHPRVGNRKGAAEAVPVVKVDSRTIGAGKRGPITLDLKKRYKR